MNNRFRQIVDIDVLDNVGKKHESLNMGSIIVRYMINDSVNKIEAQKWKGLDGDLKNTRLKELLDRSDFFASRQKAGRICGEDGEVAVMLISYGQQYYIDFFRIISSRKFKRDLYELIVRSEEFSETGEQIYYKWEKKSDGIYMTKFFHIQDVIGNVVESQTVYHEKTNYKFIPATIIRNNSMNEPDWISAFDILQELNLLSNDLSKEWEHVKTQWIATQGNYTGVQPKKINREIENGARVYGGATGNNRFGAPFDLLISGSASLIQLMDLLNYLEDKFLKYTFQGRETQRSGSNKHNAEISLWNQAQSEYAERKKHQRENDFIYFFKHIVEPITGIKAPNKINIQSSAYEQGKKDAIGFSQSQKQYYEAQAFMQKAKGQQMLSQISQGEKIKKSTQNNQ